VFVLKFEESSEKLRDGICLIFLSGATVLLSKTNQNFAILLQEEDRYFLQDALGEGGY
jgi:hypothetical protein